MTGSGPDAAEDARVGLCATCVHAHVIENRRGSRFWRCRMSDVDPRFPKYPRLPVVRCSGWERGTGSGERTA